MSTKITPSTTAHTTELSTKTNDQAIARLRDQILEEAQRQGVDMNTLMERLGKPTLPTKMIESMVDEQPSVGERSRTIDREKLLRIYQIPQLNDVAIFLEKNEFLGDLLLTAKSVIERQFPDTTLYLLVKTDPDDGTQQLVIEIASHLTDSEERIDRLEIIEDDSEWHQIEVSSQNKIFLNLH